MSKKNQNNIPIIATIVVAAIATILAFVAIVVIMMSGSKDDQDSGQPSEASSSDISYITPEYQEECQEASYNLLRNSHEILRLFVTEGLFHEDEPYGNLPEDGYYTVNSTDYTSMQQVEDLVRSVYVSDAAEKILKNIDGNGLAVYAVDKVFVEDDQPVTAEGSTEESGRRYKTEERLGISADFTPDPSKGWTSCSITINYIEEGKCGLIVALDPDDSTTEAEIEPDGISVLEMTMIKLEDGWRLTDFVTRSSAQ